jgi:hypothetical protein
MDKEAARISSIHICIKASTIILMSMNHCNGASASHCRVSGYTIGIAIEERHPKSLGKAIDLIERRDINDIVWMFRVRPTNIIAGVIWYRLITNKNVSQFETLA